MPKLPPKAKVGKDTPLAGNDEFAPPVAAEPPAKKAPAKRAAAKKTTAVKPPEQDLGAAPGEDEIKGDADFGLGFANLDDTTDHLKILLYGREGTTKTTSLALASQVCPEGSRILVVNAEGGLKIAALRKRGVDTSKIVVWPDPNSAVKINYQSLVALHERLAAQLLDKPGSLYLIGIDSITDIVEELRGQATTKRIDRAMTNPNATAEAKAMIDPDFVDRADYGVMTNQLRDWLRDMRDLPCHLVITALERYDEETRMTGPAVSPALANSVAGYCDIVAYMRATLHAPGEDDDQTDLAEVRALTRPGKATRAKDRFGLTPRVLADPTFPRFLAYCREEITEAVDPVQAAYNERREAEAAARAAAEAEKAERKAATKAPKKSAA